MKRRFSRALGIGSIGAATPDTDRPQLVRAIQFIEDRLQDAELRPSVIADYAGISPRYLHYLFARRSETVMGYVRRRRVEEGARTLMAPGPREGTVTEIALDCGFNSATQFGRAFRAHFGQSPQQFRRSRQVACDHDAIRLAADTVMCKRDLYGST